MGGDIPGSVTVTTTSWNETIINGDLPSVYLNLSATSASVLEGNEYKIYYVTNYVDGVTAECNGTTLDASNGYVLFPSSATKGSHTVKIKAGAIVKVFVVNVI